MDQVIETLRAFTQSDLYQQHEEVQLLVLALIQRLEIAAREQEHPVQAVLAS